jgi:hypothetical protein
MSNHFCTRTSVKPQKNVRTVNVIFSKTEFYVKLLSDKFTSETKNTNTAFGDLVLLWWTEEHY